MRAAVLCPGPSLEGLEPSVVGDCLLSYAVNDAVEHPYRALYWLCLDARRAMDILERGRHNRQAVLLVPTTWLDPGSKWAVGRWRKKAQQEALRMRWRVWDPPSLAADSGVGNWGGFRGLTALTAAMHAAADGADSIELYGCDMAGDGHYATGRMDAPERAGNRWLDERKRLRRLKELLAEQGKELRVVHPEGVQT